MPKSFFSVTSGGVEQFTEKLEEMLFQRLEKFGELITDSPKGFRTERGYRRLIEILAVEMPVINSLYDQYFSVCLKSDGHRVTCSKGCCFCCSHGVSSVEPFEIIYFDWSLKKRPDYGSLIFQLFERQAALEGLSKEKKVENEDILLYRYLQKDIKCPFLTKTGECGMYEQRPMPCRMFFSVSHPRFCRGSNTVLPENRNLIVELPDYIEVKISQISQLFSGLNISEFFFNGLLRANELFGRYS